MGVILIVNMGYQEYSEGDFRLRVYGDPRLPCLIHLPGIHGDWTLVQSFRAAVDGQVCFVGMSYPQSTEWRLPEYADTVRKTLAKAGIGEAWLIGESFGSQVAWEFIRRFHHPTGVHEGPSDEHFFNVLGLVLAGGFVRHPTPLGVWFVHGFWRALPLACLRAFLPFYTWIARIRHRHAPETLGFIDEFVSRRTAQDKAAIGYRFELIARNDPRRVAQAFNRPVYYLTGGIDPIVPWPWVRSWLRRHCVAFKESVVLPWADHNVLGTAPRQSAHVILNWMSQAHGAPSQQKRAQTRAR